MDMKNVCWLVHTEAIVVKHARVHPTFRCLDRQFKCRILVVADVRSQWRSRFVTGLRSNPLQSRHGSFQTFSPVALGPETESASCGGRRAASEAGAPSR